MEIGDVVISCGSGQCGTLVDVIGDMAWVLFRNGDVSVGPKKMLRIPQDQADQDSCPIDVEHIEAKRIIRED